MAIHMNNNEVILSDLLEAVSEAVLKAQNKLSSMGSGMSITKAAANLSVAVCSPSRTQSQASGEHNIFVSFDKRKTNCTLNMAIEYRLKNNEHP